MIDFFPGATQMLVAQNRIFIGALAGVPTSDLSIVIHKTACNAPCSAVDVANFFANDSAEASTHFVIDLDGSIIQCVSLADGAGGNCCLEAGHDTYWDSFASKYGNLNLCTFSIEHVDQTVDNSQTPTQAQLDASFGLVLWLCQQFGVSPDRIKTHASLDPQTRLHCPGNYPMSTLITYVRSNLVNTNQQQSILDHWNSFYHNTLAATPPRTGTGIYNAWLALYLKGKQLGPATSQEYDSVNWAGTPIVCQDFGSYRIEYYISTGIWACYGPTGQVS